MTVHEFGKDNEEVIVLIHPSAVRWDYFEYVIPFLEEKYHLVIPALPGYDPDLKSDFTSIEEISTELEGWLISRGIQKVASIYGCSMGGSVVLRFVSETKIKVHSAVLDGGITPYQLPWIITRFIAVRDFLLLYLGKLGGLRLLEKAFSTDEYSKEDLQYISDVLKDMSAKTIWRTYDSCNNYSMPDPISIQCKKMEYWFAKSEEKARKWDISYIRKKVPTAVFKCFENIGHGGLAILEPEKLAEELQRVAKD
ncbi:MAG: alpha/beta hydrolase [Oscillospiraceae bacterium]|nr:alpha/beta hydrolase [Oscillospiraceae bacterium]